jgi:hypothetical protein
VRQRKVNLFQSCCLRKTTNFSSVRSDWKAVGDKAPSITLFRCLWLTEIATAVAACAPYRQGLVQTGMWEMMTKVPDSSE